MCFAGKRPRVLLSVLALVSTLACDKVEGGGEAKGQDTPSEKPASESDEKAQPQQSEPSESEAEPSKPSEAEPSEAEPSESEPSVAPAPAKRTIESLAASVERAEDPSASGWTHLKAKDYAAAIPYFAQASLAEPTAWKHPYNLACAA